MSEEEADKGTIASEEVRVGVYTCHCGGNISHVVRCEPVATMLGRLPDVVVARTDPSLCSDAGQAIIEQDIKELGVNRVVIGACAPSLHEQTFRNALIRAGLNPYLYQHVGIREQDSWVHADDPEGATEKAIRLMAAGVAKARLLAPLDPIRLSAEKHALVIGGGVAGLRSALDIARQGIRVTLVEKSALLGGRMAELDSVFPTDEDARQLLQSVIHEVAVHPRITVLTQADVTGLSGYVGKFNVHVTRHSRGVREDLAEAAPAVDCDEPQIDELTVGAIVLATGFDPYEPRQGEYGWGELPDVVTLPRLIRILSSVLKGEPFTWNGHPVRDLAMIHCVGSRELDGVHEPQADGQVNNYCSRVCCTASLHTAVELRRRFPTLNIYDLYQDIRTYGRGHEEIYRRARSSMVRFLRYRGEERPEVVAAPDGDSHPVLVRLKDYLTNGEQIEVPVDLVVLSVGMMARQIDDLVHMLKVSRGADRFLLEAHPKLRPVEMAVRGIVLAGTAQGPMNIQESLSAASAASAKVAALLGQGQVELPPFVARVDEVRCDGTGACVHACPEEGALTLQAYKENGREGQRAVVNPANCTGCGACVGVCPTRAVDVQAWTLAQYEAMVDAIAMELPALMEAGQ